MNDQTPMLPLPGESVYVGPSGLSERLTVIASVILADDPGNTRGLLLLMTPTPGKYYAVVEIDWLEALSGDESLWFPTPGTYRVHPNIVPAVEDYQESGGDY